MFLETSDSDDINYDDYHYNIVTIELSVLLDVVTINAPCSTRSSSKQHQTPAGTQEQTTRLIDLSQSAAGWWGAG